MAVDMFLNLSGGIEGESKDKTKTKEMDILAFSWGLSQSGTRHLGTGGGAGKCNVQDISLTKYIDKASAKIAQACALGTHIDSAVLTVRKAGGDDPVEYLVYTLTDCLVTSYTTGGSGGEDRLTENLTLNFAICQFEYKGQDGKGIGANAGNFGYNIPENAKV